MAERAPEVRLVLWPGWPGWPHAVVGSVRRGGSGHGAVGTSGALADLRRAEGRRAFHPGAGRAVSNAGGIGFLAAGYRTTEAVGQEIGEVRGLTGAPFGVNLFVPQDPDVDQRAVSTYLAGLRPEDALGVDLVPVWDDDGWADKLDLLDARPVPLVSFSFGCPPPRVVTRLQTAGSRVLVTVTTPGEAVAAAEAGADALCAQGIEAGATRAPSTTMSLWTPGGGCWRCSPPLATWWACRSSPPAD